MGKFSDASSFLQQRGKGTTQKSTPSPSADLQNILLGEQIDAEVRKQETAYDPFAYRKGGLSFDPLTGKPVALQQEDLLMRGGEKLGKSLLAGTGDVMEQIVDLTQLAYNYATPFGYVERAAGLDFSKNFFDWVEENTAGELQQYAVKMKPGKEEFKWSDLGSADFWTTDFARQVPNLLSMIAGGVGLAKGAGTLMTKMATKQMAKAGTRLAKPGALANKVVDRFGNTTGYIGGKGIGKFFTKSEDALSLTGKGKMAANVAAGAGMNLVDGGIVAGMAYDRALEEFKYDENGNEIPLEERKKLAGQIAGNIFIDNTKWIAVDAASWAFTFGGGSKIIFGKTANKLNQIQSGFGKRVANIFLNASAGAGAGAAIAGAAKFGEEDMLDAMATGSALGLGAGLLRGRAGLKAAATVAPEGIEEMFQETYQEWIEMKAFDEAKGQDDKTPSYWDFYSSDKARKTKAISLMSGLAGGTVGNYTNMVNDVAEREYENDKRIDAIKSIMERSNNAETTYEKVSAMYDMVSQSVADNNEANLEAWINENTGDGKSIDTKLQSELLDFMGQQTKMRESIGTGMSNITQSERSKLFRMQAGLSKNNSEFEQQKSIYEEQMSELDEQLKSIEDSNLSEDAKESARQNIEERKTDIDSDFQELQNNVKEANSELQNEVNKYTSELLKRSKQRKSENAKTVGNAIKGAAKQVGSFANGMKNFVSGVFDGAREKSTKTEESGVQPTPEMAYNNIVDGFVDEFIASDKYDTDLFTRQQLKDIISKSFAENGINEQNISQESLEEKLDKIQESINKQHKSFVENKKNESKSVVGKATEVVAEGFKKGVEKVKSLVTPKAKEEAPVEAEVISTEKPKKKRAKTKDIEEAEIISEEEIKESEKPAKGAKSEKSRRRNANLDKEIAELEKKLEEETDPEIIENIKQAIEESKQAKKKKSDGEVSEPPTRKEVEEESTAEQKKKKNKFKNKWYSPSGILERRKARKERKQKIKEALAKYDETRKQNDIHYIYALKDAKYPQATIIALAEMSEMFGNAGTSAYINSTIYASLNAEFAKNVKHEFGHELYEVFQDTPLMQDIKRIILEDKKILKNLMVTYPELILFDTDNGPMSIEQLIESPKYLKRILKHDPKLKKVIDSIIDKNRIYTNELETIARSVVKMGSISIAPMEQQEGLIEEAFAHYLEKDDIKLADIIGSDIKTEKRLNRKANIIFNKTMPPKKTTEEQKFEIVRLNDSPASRAATFQEALEIIRREAESRKAIHKPKRNSRVRKRKVKYNNSVSLNNLAERQYYQMDLYKNIIVMNPEAYDQMLYDVLDNINAESIKSPEDLIELINKNVRVFITNINQQKNSTSNIIKRNDKFKYNQNDIDALSAMILSEAIVEGTLGIDNEIVEVLQNLELLDNNNQRIPFVFESDLDSFVVSPDSNDNPLIQNERSSTSKFIDAFVKYLRSEEGVLRLQKEAGLTKMNEGTIRRDIRREFRQALMQGGETLHISNFIDNVINPKSDLLKAFKTFLVRKYTDATGTVAGSDNFIAAVARGIHHEQSSNVVESRDKLIYKEIYKEDDPMYEFEDSFADFEQFISEKIRINENGEKLSFDIDYKKIEQLNKFGNLDLQELVEAIGQNGFNQSIVRTYIDYFALKGKKTITHKGKKLKVKDIVQKIITSNGTITPELNEIVDSISAEMVILSRDLNQTTMIEMAKLGAKTSLLNKTSALYETAVAVNKHLQDPSLETSKVIRDVVKNSVFEHLYRTKGIDVKISASSGARILTEENEYVKGDSYINMTPDEVLLSDILRILGAEESYQQAIMVFSEKSRRYNVTVPKYDFNNTEDINFIQNLAKKISKAKYSDGDKVSNLFEISSTGNIKQRITNKAELAKQVKFLKDFINDNPYVKKNLVEQGLLKTENDSLSKAQLEEIVITTALNKYSAQKAFVAEHKNRKDAVDYTKRSAMAIARRRPVFENIEYFITPDLYYNRNAEPGLEYLTSEDLESMTDEEKSEYKKVDDAASLMLPEDARLLQRNAGLGNEYGSVYKTVHSGRDTRINGIDDGDLYLKHNTVVLSDKYVRMSIKNGYPGLAKLRAIMRARKQHLFNEFGVNVPIISMSESSVKSDKKNKYLEHVKVDDIILSKEDIIDSFNDEATNTRISNEEIKTILASDKLVSAFFPQGKQSIQDFNKSRDEKFTGLTSEGREYKGFDASKFGVQNILESNRNKVTSGVPIQLISNFLQAGINTETKAQVISILDAYQNAINIASQEQLQQLEDLLQEMVDPSWAGNPMSYLVENGLINIPAVQNKLQEVISKSVIGGATKLRGPGGIAFEAAPYGFNLKSRVNASELGYDNNADPNSIVSEIILPANMQRKFRVGDVVMATRIPADKLAMTQVFVIKDFFDTQAGQIVSIPAEISSIIGSDKDGDSLFIDGKYNNKDLSSEQKAYNEYIEQSINLLSNAQLNNLMSLSLEGVDRKAEQYIDALKRKGVNVPETQKDQLSFAFDKYSSENNAGIRKVLGELIIAFRDTNYLAFHNVELQAEVQIGGKRFKSFKNSESYNEIEFISELVTLVLDNPSQLKAFTMGINNVVIKDLVLLARMGLNPQEAIEYINSDEAKAVYKYTRRNRLIKGTDPKAKYETPEFMAFLETVKKVNPIKFINNPNNRGALEQARLEFNTEFMPNYRKTGSTIVDGGPYQVLKILSAVKSDISALSDILNVYNTNPQNNLEIESRLNNWENTKNNPMIINFNDDINNDTIINGRVKALQTLKDSYQKINSISNEVSDKLSESFSKIFNFDKGYKSKNMSMMMVNNAFDQALIDVLYTDVNENELAELNNNILGAINTLGRDSFHYELFRVLKDKIYVDSTILSRATDKKLLDEYRSVLTEESDKVKINFRGKEINVSEAILTYLYNNTNNDGVKNRLQGNIDFLSIMPNGIVEKINNALSEANMKKAMKLDRKQVLDIARSNISSVSYLYQNSISLALQNNKNKFKYFELNNVLSLSNIDIKKVSKSEKALVDAMFERQGDTLVFSVDKVNAIIEGGVDIIPVIVENELHFIDLKSIINNDPDGILKKADKEEVIEQDAITDDDITKASQIAKAAFSKQPRRRKVISESSLRGFKSDMTLEEYAEARGIRKSMLKNPSMSNELKKEYNKLKTSQEAIDNFLDPTQESSLNKIKGLSKEDLMNFAVAVSTNNSIESLAKEAITKEISILIAQKARDEQMALNPEGYMGANEGDVSFLKKWLMSNDVDMNNPDVQSMARIVEKQYFNFTQEYAKEARPIKVIAKNLKQDFYKKVGALEYVKLWFKGELNRAVYKNIYDIQKQGTDEFIVLKGNTDEMTSNEKAFYNEFIRIMQITTDGSYQGSIPYHSINANEAFMRQGLYGLYMNSEGQETHLNSVPVYGNDPITGRQIQRTFKEWKELYANKSISKSSFKNLQSLDAIRTKAEDLMKSGFDEDGNPIQYDNVALKMLLDDSTTKGMVMQESVSTKEFASYDLETIALKTLRTHIFNNGSGKFLGFRSLGFLIDGVLEYNEDNPNLKQWVQSIYKEYIAKQGPQKKKSKTSRALDAFVLFTTLKVLGPWNLGIPLSNIAIGKYQQARATSMKQFLKGELRFLNPKNFKKNAALIRNYVAFDMSMYENFYSMQEKTPFDQVADLIMLPMEQSEKYIQGAAFLSYLTKEEYDAIKVDDNGNITQGVLSDDRVAQLMELVKKEQGKGYNVTNQRLTGMYATSRLLFQFKKYLPTLFVERFGKERLNRFGQYQKGSVTAVKDIVTGYATGKLTYDDIKNQPPHIKDAVRKWRNGVFMSLAIAMMAGWDDDDDWKDKLSRDTMIAYDVELNTKYRLAPATYWNLKSMVN